MTRPDRSENENRMVASKGERLRLYRERVRSRYEEAKGGDRSLLNAYLESTESTSIEKWARFLGNTWPALISIFVRTGIEAVSGGFRLAFAVGTDAFSVLTRIRFTAPAKSKRLQSPPGQRLLKLAEILFSPKTVLLTFKPLIADWQFEYFEGLANKLPNWRLRYISIRYYWYYAKACGLSKVAELFRSIARSRS
jgi:hypothetical protein